MALKTCKECKNPVSTEAKMCPNCGAPVKKSKRFGCFGVIIAVIIVFAILSNMFSGTNTSSTSSTQIKSDSPTKPQQQAKTEFIDFRQPSPSVVKKIPIKNADGNIVTYENGIEQSNLRTGPGMNYAVDQTGTLGENEKLYVLEEKDGWIRFRTTKENHDWSAWIKKELTVSIEEIMQARKAKFGEPPAKNLDGSYTCIKEYLKSTARDPDSLIYEQWSDVNYNENDGWLVMCEFRAKNGFGGYERDAKWFIIRNGHVADFKNIDAYK
jgi:uncharacterized protein YgiM (DUF1202 family)